MTRTRDRAFAWFGIVIVLFSAGALIIAVIVQSTVNNQDSSANTNNSQVNNCSDDTSEPTLAAPAAFTVSGSVSALQATDLTPGSGRAVKAGDCLVVKYFGTLAKDGTLFDENYTKPTAFAFTLGQGQVIKGWDEGVAGMKAGGERRLVIPATLAYGNQAQGSIPANSDLVFYVTLLRIK